MRTMRIVVAVLAGALAAAGIVAVGCSVQSGPGSCEAPAYVPKAHGGTDNVNDAALDAMFFRNYGVNPFVDSDDNRLSTFAVDVDTGSYTLCRSYLGRGAVPPKDAVRVEEFVNYFDYGYSPPEAGSVHPFAAHLEAAPSKFSPGRILMRVGLKAREVAAADRKNAVLTVVIDVSGSMEREDRLGLVKKALRLLVDQLREGDEVGIAVYGSVGRKVMDHRSVERRGEILQAIESLRPDGSTNAEEGIAIGYEMAAKAFRPGAINRVILCSDGVANVGRTGPEAIMAQIRERAAAGITLSTVGFGMGNYNDVLMEQLADKGHGNYAYVDTLSEARRVFVRNLTGMLQVVARDAKVQVEFNPGVVRSWRLLGYENRALAAEDFRNDKVDGGEIGAGHRVTALYEVKLWADKRGPLATVRLRYKNPDDGEAREFDKAIASADVAAGFDAASPAFRLAACAAEFAEVLRSSYWARGHTLAEVVPVARQCAARLDGSQDDLKELVTLMEKAQGLGVEKRALASSSMEE